MKGILRTLIFPILIGTSLSVGINQILQKRSNNDPEPTQITIYMRSLKNIGVEVENDFGYVGDHSWHERLNSLERLSRNNPDSITSKIISDLCAIVRGDQDSRIKNLAASMIGSYDGFGNFSAVRKYGARNNYDERIIERGKEYAEYFWITSEMRES